MIAARDDAEADVRHARGDPQEELEVAVRVGADRDDVGRRRGPVRREDLGIDAERDELDPGPGAVLHHPALDVVRLAPAVGDDNGAGAERGGV